MDNYSVILCVRICDFGPYIQKMVNQKKVTQITKQLNN